MFKTISGACTQLWREHKASILALCFIVFGLGFCAGANAQSTFPSWGEWNCKASGAYPNCAQIGAQQAIATINANRDIALAEAQAQQQVSIARLQNQNGQQYASGAVAPNAGVMQSPQAQQCAAQGGRVVQTGPSSYTCQGGQGQQANPAAGQSNGQYPVCQQIGNTPDGGVLLRASNGSPVCIERTTNTAHNCNGGALIFWPNRQTNSRFACTPPQQQVVVYGQQQPQGYVQMQPQPVAGYAPQQAAQQSHVGENLLSAALGAAVGYYVGRQSASQPQYRAPASHHHRPVMYAGGGGGPIPMPKRN